MKTSNPVGKHNNSLFLPVLIVIHFLILCSAASAQSLLLTNEQHYGVEEGLPQSFISGITQDEDGFIWLATLDGLCRFDGRNFKTIKFHPNDPRSLAANAISCLGVPVNNILPIFYSIMQADAYDMRTFKVTRNKQVQNNRNLSNARWDWFGRVSPTSDLLFTTINDNGVGWIAHKNGKVAYANRANGLLQQDTVHAMIQALDGSLYLVSANGVQVSDSNRKHFKMYRFDTKVKKRPNWFSQLQEVGSYCIALLSPTNLLLLDGNRLIFLDIINNTSRILNIPQQYNKSTVPSELMYIDGKGRPYFTNTGRIFRLEDDGQLKMLWENTRRPDLRINEMFIDRTDVLWVSVDAQGLLKVDLHAPAFKSFAYKNNFITDVLQQAFGSAVDLPKAWNNDEATYYFRQVRDTRGNLYAAGSLNGISQVFSINAKGVQALPGPARNWGHTALVNLPGDILAAYDQNEYAWYRWKDPALPPAKHDDDAESMKGVEVADAAFIGGYTWVSTYQHGLLQYDGRKIINRFQGTLAAGSMPKALTEICPDPIFPGKFWIGSRGGGLILWDVKKGLQRVYTVEDGLPNNTIYCILPDRFGTIWCSTNKGIFRLNQRTKQIVGYQKTDGLPGNEFNRAHKFAFADGRLCFGGLDGYTIFDPADFVFNTMQQDVPVMLTGFQINNRSQNIDVAGSIVQEPLSTLSSVQLNHNENYLRFEFAAMHFNQPLKTKYRYRLEGVDKEWIENGNNNTASYAALPPGTYTLHINASTTNGEWSNFERTLHIRINSPMWATWWAYMIYAFLLFFIARQYFIFRVKRFRTIQSLAFEKKEAVRLREMDEQKDRYFSNITHEFRTPLTLILSPLEKLLQDTTLSAPVIHTLETAQGNAHQLLRLINEFLDFSKVINGQVKLKSSIGELHLFVAACVQTFAGAAAAKQIELHFINHGIAGMYSFDEEKLEKILINLLSNAMKFTPAYGQVTVSLTTLPGDIMELVVTDNGLGIGADEQQKIFERFYQVDDTSIRSHGGTGIGLALVKELITTMNGQVIVQSQIGGPTSFIIQIPVEKMASDYLRPILPVTEAEPVPFHLNGGDTVPIILVVEDNAELRGFLVESMGLAYKCLQAADGAAAWKIILHELPDIVISDVMMPEMDGFDLCHRCKTDNRTAHIGFIMLTSKAAHEGKLKGLKTGADDYITKPFNTQELDLRTANLLQLQQSVRVQLQAMVLPSAPVEIVAPVTNPFLQQLYAEIDVKINDANLGVDYLSKTMNMSRSTLNRKLQALLGTSPNELIRQYRLQKATGYLAAGVDVSTAAYKTGFNSPSYFTQCFKEHYQITPTEWMASRNVRSNAVKM